MDKYEENLLGFNFKFSLELLLGCRVSEYYYILFRASNFVIHFSFEHLFTTTFDVQHPKCPENLLTHVEVHNSFALVAAKCYGILKSVPLKVDQNLALA